MNYWISVEDKLPGEGELVLVVNNGYVDVGIYTHKGYHHEGVQWYGYNYDNYGDDFILTNVAYWQHLPEPPEPPGQSENTKE